nr:MAG TPA: hypothetical protein [Caudoviricetes sp.]
MHCNIQYLTVHCTTYNVVFNYYTKKRSTMYFL